MNCGIFKQQYLLVESGWVVGAEGLGGGGGGCQQLFHYKLIKA